MMVLRDNHNGTWLEISLLLLSVKLFVAVLFPVVVLTLWVTVECGLAVTATLHFKCTLSAIGTCHETLVENGITLIWVQHCILYFYPTLFAGWKGNPVKNCWHCIGDNHSRKTEGIRIVGFAFLALEQNQQENLLSHLLVDCISQLTLKWGELWRLKDAEGLFIDLNPELEFVLDAWGISMDVLYKMWNPIFMMKLKLCSMRCFSFALFLLTMVSLYLQHYKICSALWQEDPRAWPVGYYFKFTRINHGISMLKWFWKVIKKSFKIQCQHK